MLDIKAEKEELKKIRLMESKIKVTLILEETKATP